LGVVSPKTFEKNIDDMKKTHIVIITLALVTALSQCRKPALPNHDEPGEIIRQNATLITTTGGDSKVSLDGDLTKVLKLKWDGNEKIYVYDGYGMCGRLDFSSYVGEGQSAASFSGDITPHSGSKLRFYLFNNETDESKIPGVTDNTVTFTSDYSTQSAPNIGSVISDFVLRSDEMEISDDGKYNNVKLKSPVAIMRSSFNDFGEGNIAVKGLESTGFTIDYTGKLEYNTNTSATLVNPGDGGDFFVVLMPKTSAKFVYYGSEGVAYPDWAINAGTYYTLYGSDGDAVTITAREFTTTQPVVTTNTNVVQCQYKGGNMGGTVSSSVEQYCECGLVYAPGTLAQLDLDNGTRKFVKEMFVSTETSYYYDLTDEAGLTAGATYSMRAYAIGESGTPSYGDIKTFVAGDKPQNIPASWTDGASPYVFTVSSGRTVRFSQGNLQYIGSAATPYWKFAEHQFDIIGYSQMGTVATNIDRDLFGWGTSGWNNGNHCYQPYSLESERTAVTYAENQGWGYGPKNGTNYSLPLTGTYANADWGVYNAISNGGNASGLWRTLTKTEWTYLFGTTTNRKNQYGLATIAGCTPGLIILPDKTSWVIPSGLTFTSGTGNGWNTNTYTYAQWKLMETNGAVFLPTTGDRHDTNMGNIGGLARYWSSTNDSRSEAYALDFDDDSVDPDISHPRYYGFSVRLVK